MYTRFVRKLVFSLAFIFTSIAIAQEVPEVPETPEVCRTSREYITALEYLRENSKKFGIEDSQARKLAEIVASGCTGAAQRFISTLDLLVRVEMGTNDAIDQALSLSSKTDKHAKAFREIFKRLFLKKYLDLDLITSLSVAKKLSVDFKGNVESVASDFYRLVEFCLEHKVLGLSLKQCGQLAGRVAALAERWNMEVSREFIEQYQFLKSDLGLSISESLALAEEIVAISPHAVSNFIDGYKYASSRGGLDLPAKEALGFAKKLAVQTLKKDTEL